MAWLATLFRAASACSNRCAVPATCSKRLHDVVIARCGIDISAPMLELATTRFARAGLTGRLVAGRRLRLRRRRGLRRRLLSGEQSRDSAERRRDGTTPARDGRCVASRRALSRATRHGNTARRGQARRQRDRARPLDVPATTVSRSGSSGSREASTSGSTIRMRASRSRTAPSSSTTIG